MYRIQSLRGKTGHGRVMAIVKSNDVVIRGKASEMAKSVIGKNGVEVIKKILKR